MDWYLLLGEGVQTVEDGVDVSDGCIQVEDDSKVDATGDLGIALNELGKICLFFPGTHRVTLDQPVRIVASEARIDESQQEPMAEDEPVTRLEVPPHPLRMNNEALDDPGKTVEDVIECEERVGNDDSLCGRLRDVALVPERHILQADQGIATHNPGQPADALGHFRVPLVWHGR